MFFYITGVIMAIFIILVLAAPKKYAVDRSVVIQRPVSEVYSYLKMIKNQDQWSPWKKRDPNYKESSTGTDGTVGFVHRWDSDHKQVGAGQQQIKKLVKNQRIESELRFLKPWKSVSKGFFDLEEIAKGSTKVTWGFYGFQKPPMNVMMLFYNMDKAVGNDFEEGLTDLKKVLEN